MFDDGFLNILEAVCFNISLKELRDANSCRPGRLLLVARVWVIRDSLCILRWEWLELRINLIEPC